MCFFVACRADPRPAQDMFRKMASLPHCAQGLGAEQGAAQVCRCRAAGATRSARLPPRHRSRQTAGSEKECSESLRLQGCPQSWFPPATSRARGSGLGPQAGAIYPPGGTAKARVTCCIRGVPHLLGRALYGMLPATAAALGPWARAACCGQLPTFACSPPEECAQEVGGAGKRLF